MIVENYNFGRAISPAFLALLRLWWSVRIVVGIVDDRRLRIGRVSRRLDCLGSQEVPKQEASGC